MTAKGEFFPRRINQHVPDCNYAADVRKGGGGKITIPAMPVAATEAIATGIDISAIVVKLPIVTVETFEFSDMGKFGRNLLVKASGASTVDVTINGQDFFGQKMSEEFTLNGTTDVVGIKAFTSVDSISVPVGSGVTVSIGYGDVLGLPYRLVDVYTELVDGDETADAGAFIVGVDLQAVDSADPRGTYTPHVNNVPDGAREWAVNGLWFEGNLHGNAQFSA